MGPVKKPSYYFKAVSALMAGFFLLPLMAHSAPKAEVESAMRLATEFMVEKVSYKGGYVWSYLPDFSRRWGEMEATPTMIWIQPPGTATMGHVFLDAYHVTGDEYYYQAATEVAKALMLAQHASGGWNYMADLSGNNDALKNWYATIGKNGWRLEEFHFYLGNATFDDGGTSEASKFLLRLYLEKKDTQYKPALDLAIDFVLKAQNKVGGWPQRFPKPTEPVPEKSNYSNYITLNDDVAMGNIEFLLLCYQAFKQEALKQAAIKAMDSFIALQLPAPQAGWAQQYTEDLQPVGARSYEPKALATKATVHAIIQLMKFYQLTGEAKYLAPIMPAFKWLESVKLPEQQIDGPRTHPTFVEIGSNEPIYTHRTGSNVISGQYYVDTNPDKTLAHFGAKRRVPIQSLKAKYQRLLQGPRSRYTDFSPLLHDRPTFIARYFTLEDINSSDLNSKSANTSMANDVEVRAIEIAAALNSAGYWPVKLKATTNPYIGPGPSAPTPGDFSQTLVGDKWDTSPYTNKNPVEGVSTGLYIKNMTGLIRYLADVQRRANAKSISSKY